MATLSDADLETRFWHLVDNAIRVNPNGRFFLMHGPWIDRWKHIEAEYQFRNKRIPDYHRKLNGTVSRTIDKAAKLTSGRDDFYLGELYGQYLFKYGEARWLELAYDHGHIRVKPASSYQDPSLNPAIRDDELTLTVEFPPSEVMLQRIDRNSGIQLGDPIVPSRVVSTYRAPCDYYVYCLSKRFDLRLFEAFNNYDACLVIKDIPRFIRVFLKALEANKRTLIGAEAGLLNYLDPLDAHSWELDVMRCKHFRHEYQQEYRISAVPRFASNLEPIDLILGGLHEFAELVVL